MANKKDVGHAMGKVVRILPGIGSYQDRETGREADKALRMQLSERLNRLLGDIEWLKTDLTKKGAFRHIQPVEDLSRHVEKVSRTLEFAPRGYSSLFSRKQVDEEALNRIYEYDKGLSGLIEEIEKSISEITEAKEVPSENGLSQIRKRLLDMEKRISQREAFLDSQPAQSGNDKCQSSSVN